MRLEGRRALVTAAASGIGAAIATTLHDNGARVHVCDLDERALESFVAQHPGISRSHTDVADEQAVARLFDDVQASLGGLDILVNNAGVAGPTGYLHELELVDWQRTLDVNLNATFLCTRLAVPLLKAAGGGSIVNLSSTAGIMGYPLRTPYAAAKWAIVGLTKSLAMELGEHGIRVNCICPGAVEGPRMQRVIDAEASAKGVSAATIEQGYHRINSLRRFVTAGEIADMALFVCSPAGAAVSGQALCVDGHTEMISAP